MVILSATFTASYYVSLHFLLSLSGCRVSTGSVHLCHTFPIQYNNSVAICNPNLRAGSVSGPWYGCFWLQQISASYKYTPLQQDNETVSPNLGPVQTKTGLLTCWTSCRHHRRTQDECEVLRSYLSPVAQEQAELNTSSNGRQVVTKTFRRQKHLIK